jgi:hypothetical protein
MPVIYSQLLSMSDAEEAVVEIWCILEEHDLPSPGMTFTFCGSSGVKIALSVDDSADAHTLKLLSASVNSAVEPLHWVRGEVHRIRCPHILRSVVSSRFLRAGNDRSRRLHGPSPLLKSCCSADDRLNEAARSPSPP